ncbi:MAG: DNA replication/repair protein RecF [Bacteroidetes bacterium]|nr:DNA replication/repair protein RecF [Bacteroidota bacterium]
MHLERLQLHNFKNYSLAEIEICEGINAFVGKNGSGKTNILDAVHYLSMCKSYVNTIDRQNVKFQESFFSIFGDWIQDAKLYSEQCSFKIGGKKTIKLNKKEYDRISDHVGKFPVVFISPYDNDLISEGSELRRKWIDGILVQLDKHYLDDLIKYYRALEHRNALLKNMYEHRLFDRDAIEMWNIPLVETGQKIFEKRTSFINEFIPVFNDFYQQLVDGGESTEISYKSQLQEQNLLEALKSSEKKDTYTQYTNVGIHKDDLIFTIANYPVKKFGSQGQQKTFLIALRLAQFDWMKKQKGFAPILLLDDIFDKLDQTRVERLISLVTNKYFGQVFLTDTDEPRMRNLMNQIRAAKKLFKVEDSEVVDLV